MITKFVHKRVSGILTVLPDAEVRFDDEARNYAFPERQTLRLKRIMGYEKHRIAKTTTATSDLCVYGLAHLLHSGCLKRDEIGAIVVLTITPDHFVPHVSNIVQSRCCLPESVLCMDIAQGCAGFILGLFQSFLLLEHMDKKVVLINADVLSHKVSKQDRNSYPLIGDAACITVVENDPNGDEIVFDIRMDGTRGGALIIPAGGSRMPCTAATSEMRADAEGNLRALDNMCMDGATVFQFVQTAVPPLIHETLLAAGVEKEDVDWYVFHQPNRFMLRKLAEKLGVPYDKMPMNIVENFGNPSGSSIPLCITYNLAELMLRPEKQLCCLSAFGGGLAWGALTMRLGAFDFCEMLYSDL